MFSKTIIVSNKNQNFTTRNISRQSALELQKHSEARRTQKILKFFSEQNSQINWQLALSGLVKAHKQGLPVSSDSVAPIIRAAPHAFVARDIYSKAHSKNFFAAYPSNDCKIAIIESCAKFSDWSFALQLVTRGILTKKQKQQQQQQINQTNSVPFRLEDDLVQKYAEETLHCLAKTTQENNSHWALALATFTSLRNPHKNYQWNSRLFFKSINEKKQQSTEDGSQEGRRNDFQKNNNNNGGADAVTLQPNRPYKQIKITPEITQHLMSVLGKAGRWTESISLLKALERQFVPITTPTYEGAIRACYTQNKHPEVVSIVKRLMQETKNTLREPVARLALRSLESSTTLTKSINGLPSPKSEAATFWRTSLTIFQALADQGLALTRQTYESPLRCCVAAGRWEAAAKLVTEMRRDGLTAGTNVIETVLSAKLAYGCANSEEAKKIFNSLIGQMSNNNDRDGDDDRQQLGAIMQRSTRTYNALLAAAVQDQNLRLVSSIVRQMQRYEILHDKETKKWLLRAAYYHQDWGRVLRNFLLLRKDVIMEIRGAESFGYNKWPAEYELDDDIARMVLDACEMIGLGDNIARAVAEAVLVAKSESFGLLAETSEKANETATMKLLPVSSLNLPISEEHGIPKNEEEKKTNSTTEEGRKNVGSLTLIQKAHQYLNSQRNISSVAQRIEDLRMKIRNNEFGESSEAPAGLSQDWKRNERIGGEDKFQIEIDETLLNASQETNESNKDVADATKKKLNPTKIFDENDWMLSAIPPVK